MALVAERDDYVLYTGDIVDDNDDGEDGGGVCWCLR